MVSSVVHENHLFIALIMSLFLFIVEPNLGNRITLIVVDIVNFVNLKFVSEKYGHTPAEIVKMRAKGDNFVAIHKKVKANKGQKKRAKIVAAKHASKDKAKGKKKKH